MVFSDDDVASVRAGIVRQSGIQSFTHNYLRALFERLEAAERVIAAVEALPAFPTFPAFNPDVAAALARWRAARREPDYPEVNNC